MTERWSAGVLHYAEMGYWQPDYVPKPTDVLAAFRVTKHAGASAASVLLRCDPGLVSLRVTDDGAGFAPDAAAGGFGLSGMAERAELVGGHLDVRSGPGRGTTIEARIPVTPPR